MKKLFNKEKIKRNLPLLAVLLIGFGFGYFIGVPGISGVAPAQEIEHAKNDIKHLYQERIVDSCLAVNKGSSLAADKYELTYRNLRINSLADRAIISDCSDFDTLLYKNKNGDWVPTSVNLQISNRVNPQWQKACGIQDITVADDQVRSENSSIDQMNLEECNQISQL